MFLASKFYCYALALLLGLMLPLSWSQSVSAWPSYDRDSGINGGLSGTHAPGVGKLLVAMPSLKDPHFNNAVVLLVRYSAKGAVGLIINRPTRLTLATEFEALVSKSLEGDALFWGGPVGMNRRVMLVERGTDETDAKPQKPLMERLYFANSLQQFQDLLSQDQPQQRFRIYAGYAGWGASQLEHEILRGDWIVMPGNVDLIMQSDTESIWPQLINYRHGQMASLTQPAGLTTVPSIAGYSVSLWAAASSAGPFGLD